MLSTARSFLASNRDASRLVERGEKFSLRLPVVGKVAVPPPDQLAFYGVLGALAAGGLIDWPVALAIGVGQVVLARHFSDGSAAPPPAAPAAREDVAAAPAEAATAPRKAAPQQDAEEGLA
ncbi:MAG: hypothetical protein WBO08_14190 [Mycobacterium sp.]|nr:hypothetical protein [Mycobacterium sp.]